MIVLGQTDAFEMYIDRRNLLRALTPGLIWRWTLGPHLLVSSIVNFDAAIAINPLAAGPFTIGASKRHINAIE